MADAIIKRVALYQSLADGSRGRMLGYAHQTMDGWWFYPTIPGRLPSRRRDWPSFTACLPRWTGGLSRTMSMEI